jgi:hypothetical protein
VMNYDGGMVPLSSSLHYSQLCSATLNFVLDGRVAAFSVNELKFIVVVVVALLNICGHICCNQVIKLDYCRFLASSCTGTCEHK